MSTLESNIAKADKYLARFREQGVQNQIGGEAVPAGDGTTFETISPVDLRPLADVAHGKAADINAAAKAAKKAFPSWAALSGDKRKQHLHKIADAIVARAEEIAFTECMDTGQTLKFMAKAALRGAENFRFFADRAPEARDGKVLRTEGQLNMTARAPIGPVGIITPWNTPFMLSTWKIAPALAAGCTVVHKPAEFSPLTARLLVEIAEASGLPPGVWNLVNGFGEDAGKALTEHPDIKAIGFVGESRTGSLIMKQGADTLKRVHFELGGKNPVIVFADADLERAADAAVFMIYSLNGERCTSSSRLLVEQTIYARFTEIVAEKAKRIRIGHPLDTLTVLACFAFVLFVPYSSWALKAYIALAIFSCLFVTKDEFVHKECCPASEQWLHALLFLNHPIVLTAAGLLWTVIAQSNAPAWMSPLLPYADLLRSMMLAQTGIVSLFCLYQVIYWNLLWKEKSTTPSMKN